MGYGDFAPPSGHHAKKPLTKAQIKKLEQAYKNADIVTAEVRKLEEEEQLKINTKIENELNLL